LVGKTLAKVLAVHSSGSSDVVTVASEELDLSLDSREGTRIHLDWSKVLFFDDAALLELLLGCHHLLGKGVSISHFGPSRTRGKARKRSKRAQAPFPDHVYRQLIAVGYFRLWMSDVFGASENEILRLSSMSPLTSLGPLPSQQQVLPIVCCHDEYSVSESSSEEATIRQYEDAIAAEGFVESAEELHGKSQLVVSGEFGYLVLRQTRDNVVEHASLNGGGLALSTARIFTKAGFEQAWGLSYEELQERTVKAGVRTFLDRLDEHTPILDMVTADNGRGISASLGKTWYKHTLERSEAWDYVNSIADGTWSEEARIIEFAIHEDGTRKTEDWRSKETSGLDNIDRLIEEHAGYLEITSGISRILHTHRHRPHYSRAYSVQESGTLVRTIFPLLMRCEAEGPRRSRRAAARALLSYSSDAPPSIATTSLREVWDDLRREFDRGEDRIPHLDSNPRVVERLVKRLNSHDEKVRLALVDWAELQWTDHQYSLFLETVLREIRSDRVHLPIVFVNVPEEILVLAPRASSLFSDQPRVPICLFMEDGVRRHWLGLSEPTFAPLIDTFIDPSRRRLGINGEMESEADQFLRCVFDAILSGEQKPSTLKRFTDPSVVAETIRLLDSCPLFEESTIRTGTGEELPTRQYYPIVPLEAIEGEIAKTFTRQLQVALQSEACAFPPRPTGRARGKNESVVLPSGRVVDRYYHSDGLLDFPASSAAVDPDAGPWPQVAFRRRLAEHLVDLAREIESRASNRFDLVISCTSPTHWFVHQIADGLSGNGRTVGHLVARSRADFRQELAERGFKRGANALVFTDVISSGRSARTMIQAAKESGLVTSGFIALADCRSQEEKTHDTDTSDPQRGVPVESRVVLVQNLPAMQVSDRKPQWRVDPETLEPIPLSASKESWEAAFGGTGELAEDGEEVVRWLTFFSALRFGHLEHGGRDSTFLCDVRRLFQHQEVRNTVGARLRYYVLRHGIDLIVYPNHSNAYMMVEMFRGFYPAGIGGPRIQMALCRTRDGERNYVLPLGTTELERGNVLILDDGAGSGATIRSLITAAMRRFDHVASIHIVVFSNELPSGHRAFWETMSGEAWKRRSKSRRRQRTPQEIHLRFSSFMTLPLRSFPSKMCPICAKYRSLKREANDRTRSFFERDFLDSWRITLERSDLYHDPDGNPTDLSRESRSALKALGRETHEALQLARFEIALQSNSSNERLLIEACSSKASARVQIGRLESLLLARQHYLSAEETNRARQKLLDLLAEPSRSLLDRLAILQALITERVTGCSLQEFEQVLGAAVHELAEPLILGGILRFARQSATKGSNTPDWDRDELRNAFESVSSITSDPSVLTHLQVLSSWLEGSRGQSIGACARYLREAILDREAHSGPRSAIRELYETLESAEKHHEHPQESMERLRRTIPPVLDLMQGMEGAASTLLPSTGEIVRSDDIARIQHQRTRLERLWHELNQDSHGATWKDSLSKRRTDLAGFEGTWLDGHVRTLIQPFWQPIAAALQDAIERADEVKLKDYPLRKVNHTFTPSLKTMTDVDVLLDSPLLSDTLQNMAANIRKHVIPEIKDGQEVEANWQLSVQRKRLRITLCNSGPIMAENPDYFHEDGGNQKVRRRIKDFGGRYSVKTDPESGRCRAELEVFCRRTAQ